MHPVSYVVYFARTPIEVKEDDEGNDDEEENVQSLDQVDPDWVMEHSKQGSKYFHYLGLENSFDYLSLGNSCASGQDL